MMSGGEFKLEAGGGSDAPPISAGPRSWGPTGSFRPPEEESSVPPRSYGSAGSYRPPEESNYDVAQIDYDPDELMAAGLDEPGVFSSIAPPATSDPPPVQPSAPGPPRRPSGGRFDLELAEDDPVAAKPQRPAGGVVRPSDQPVRAGGVVRPNASFPDAQPAVPSSMAPPKLEEEQPRGLLYQMRVPLILMGLGLLLTVIDMALARNTGGTLSLGPVRLRWIAAALVLLGIVTSFWALVGGDKDDE